MPKENFKYFYFLNTNIYYIKLYFLYYLILIHFEKIIVVFYVYQNFIQF